MWFLKLKFVPSVDSNLLSVTLDSTKRCNGVTMHASDSKTESK